MVVGQCVNPEGLTLGDIIIFQRIPYGVRMAHRVVNIHPDGVETLGDNNIVPDGFIRNDMILSRVILVIPFPKETVSAIFNACWLFFLMNILYYFVVKVRKRPSL